MEACGQGKNSEKIGDKQSRNSDPTKSCKKNAYTG
jgi:hypothetical protein